MKYMMIYYQVIIQTMEWAYIKNLKIYDNYELFKGNGMIINFLWSNICNVLVLTIWNFNL